MNKITRNNYRFLSSGILCVGVVLGIVEKLLVKIDLHIFQFLWRCEVGQENFFKFGNN